MTTINALRKLYAYLSPEERVPLIMDAARRDDNAAWQALVDSAPRVAYKVPDYYGISEGFQVVTTHYAAEMLEHCALFWAARYARRSMEIDGLERATAFRIVQRSEGFLRFCEDLTMKYENLMLGVPGSEVLDTTLNACHLIAFTPEEMRQWLQDNGREVGDLGFDTFAVAYRGMFDHVSKSWR